MSPCTTPVLLISFNRPDHVRRVLEAIKVVLPNELYVFQDGPRNEMDENGCREVRHVVETVVDWPCSIHTFFAEENLGCGPGPAAAITWFFENVDQGIILEDDAVPHQDFFAFATEMLERYAADRSVMAIGSMKLGNKIYGDGSFYFSKMNHTLCAWATWKRAWDLFDYRLKDFSIKDLNKCLKRYGARLREREYWSERLREIHKDALNDTSWDQQFWMSIWRYGGKGILPNANLCSNIGFDKQGTHTKSSSSPAANLKLESILPIKYPTTERIQKKADLDFQKNYFQPWVYGWRGFKNLPYRINRRIKRLFGHTGPWIKKSTNER